MAVNLVLNRSKERPSVVDECADIGGGVIATIGCFDQFASNFDYRFVRKQVFVQISGLYLVLSELVHVAGIAEKIFDVFKLGDRVVLDERLKHV